MKALPPESDPWFECVRKRTDELTAVFSDSYQRNDRGDALHINRIIGAKAWLFIVEDADGCLVGASYVFRGGRRAASGVVTAHQRHGHYVEMVKQSVGQIPDQFTEITPSNSRQRSALLGLGFAVQNHEVEVRKLLGPLLRPLIQRTWVEDGALHYERLSFDRGDRREYLLLQRGTPLPVVQSSPYYDRGLS